MARYVTGWQDGRPPLHGLHHVETIINWMLAKRRQDQDARTVALTLARALAAGDVHGLAEEMIQPFIPILLAEFPEVVWPLIGQAIVKDGVEACRLRHLLEGPPSFGDDEQPPPRESPHGDPVRLVRSHPEVAPAFVARVVPFLAPATDDTDDASLNPLYRRLLDDFGHCDGVLGAAWANISQASDGTDRSLHISKGTSLRSVRCAATRGHRSHDGPGIRSEPSTRISPVRNDMTTRTLQNWRCDKYPSSTVVRATTYLRHKTGNRVVHLHPPEVALNSENCHWSIPTCMEVRRTASTSRG